jgi:3-methyl-2-oxobutanoate hydroxymethyltransferase
MAHHVAAVARTKPDAHIVADLPWMSYHVSASETVRNAATLVRAGAHSVKLEGGRKRLPMIECIRDAEIPVMGHIGLTPQSVHAMGGFKVQGRKAEAARRLVQAAKSLAHAGCYALVLEGVPVQVAEMVTEAVEIPTIGIGAGPHCDGQVLVYHDLLGFEQRLAPKFVRRYADLHTAATQAVRRFSDDVRSGAFPTREESYHLSEAELAALGVAGV